MNIVNLFIAKFQSLSLFKLGNLQRRTTFMFCKNNFEQINMVIFCDIQTRIIEVEGKHGI